MKKAGIISVAVLFLLVSASLLHALDMSGVIAYPVPFNPRKDASLKIANPGTYSMKVEIFDINGDPVCTKSGSVAFLYWNGRNEKGNYVKPGMYIIKISAENISTGDYGKKIIRILVDY